MSTQKAKFELFARLQGLGFSYEEAAQLRRISMTLSRWSEAECNGEIERDEKTDRPFRVSAAWIAGMTDKRTAWPIADREAGAMKRCRAIMARHPSLWFYHQSDPRGCALYVGRKSDLPKMDAAEIARLEGESAARSNASCLRATVSQYYTRGVAVCA